MTTLKSTGPRESRVVNKASRFEEYEHKAPAESVEESAPPPVLCNQDPLKAARARGEVIGTELLVAEGKPLSATEVGAILHVTRAKVDRMRSAGRLLAVDAGPQGIVFPSWQFSEHGVLPGLREALEELRNLSPWTQMQFFLNKNLRLAGATPLEELRKGNLADVRRAARNYGEQGAA
jgi:hypothetical protein